MCGAGGRKVPRATLFLSDEREVGLVFGACVGAIFSRVLRAWHKIEPIVLN